MRHAHHELAVPPEALQVCLSEVGRLHERRKRMGRLPKAQAERKKSPTKPAARES